MIITFTQPTTNTTESLNNATIINIDYSTYPKYITYTVSHINERSRRGEIDFKINIPYTANPVNTKNIDKKYLIDTINRHLVNSDVKCIDIMDIHNLVLRTIANKPNSDVSPTSLTSLASAVLGVVAETGKKFANKDSKGESANEMLLQIARNIESKRPPAPPRTANLDYCMIPINEPVTLIVPTEEGTIHVLASILIAGIVIGNDATFIHYTRSQNSQVGDAATTCTLRYAMSDINVVYATIANVLFKEDPHVIDLVKLQATLHKELGV